MAFEETERVYSKHRSYSATNGSAESPAASAESANSWIPDDSGEARARKGLTMILGAMFLVGEMAGAGVLNLPKAMANIGWVGVPLIIILCAGVGYSGTRLAECWVLLEERWPEYRVPCRRPYPAIAYRALGKAGQYVAEIALNITLFGASTVFLLLAVQMIHTLVAPLIPSLTTCEWTLIIGGALTPLTWLGTPKDFWPASILAMTATFAACIVVMVRVVMEKNSFPTPTYPAPTFSSFFLGFGSILFALGGASIFPTVQNDMKNRTEFKSSVIVAFLALLSIYLPLMTICYGLLGSGVKDNILMNVSGPAVTVVNAFIFVHFVFALSIVVNPVMQALEGGLSIPNRFSGRRCTIRSLVMALVVLTALAIPEFGKILDFIGGSSVTLMSFILPPLCYLRLCSAERAEGVPQRNLRLFEKILLYTIIVVGVVGGVASTYSALKEIISPKAFSSTCFSRKTFL